MNEQSPRFEWMLNGFNILLVLLWLLLLKTWRKSPERAGKCVPMCFLYRVGGYIAFLPMAPIFILFVPFYKFLPKELFTLSDRRIPKFPRGRETQGSSRKKSQRPKTFQAPSPRMHKRRISVGWGKTTTNMTRHSSRIKSRRFIL